MNYLWGAVNAISAPYQYYKDINPATLTGAIDVIVIRRLGLNGTTELVGSPFHVRFGKWQVLRPSEKKVRAYAQVRAIYVFLSTLQVDIAVNGKAMLFNMKIGEAGEAFFVFETDGDVPDDLITSPLLEPTQRPSVESPPSEYIGGSGAGGSLTDDVVGQEPDFLDLDAPSTLPPMTVSKSPLSSNLSVDTSSQPGGTSSNSIDSVDSTVPTSVESEEERLPNTHGNSPVARDVAHSAIMEHGDSYSKASALGELGDEASPRLDVENVFVPHRSKIGGEQHS